MHEPSQKLADPYLGQRVRTVSPTGLESAPNRRSAMQIEPDSSISSAVDERVPYSGREMKEAESARSSSGATPVAGSS